MKSIDTFINSNRKFTAFIVFFFSLLPVLLTLTDIGISWDEVYLNDDAAKIYVDWGKLAFHQLRNGNLNFASAETIDRYFGAIVDDGRINWHPPFARFLGGISWHFLKDIIGDFKAYRLPSAILFALESTFLFLIVSEYFGFIAAFLASSSLMLMPHVFGHAHIFALDTPISAMWFFTVLCFIYGLRSKGWTVASGIMLGLALSTKIHAVLIPGALFLWYLLTRDKRVKLNFISMFFFSIPVFIISWPWLWHNTFSRLMGFENDQIGDLSTNFKFTYYLGEISSYAIPWHYVPVMLVFTVPPLILLSAIAGIIAATKEGVVNNNGKNEKWNIALMFFINAIVMLGIASAPGIPKYDGIRLFLPAFTFLAGLSGIGASVIIKKFINKRWQKISICVIFVVIPLTSLLRIHPYELSYFNSLAGGISGAHKMKLETTYWGDAFNPSFLSILKERFRGKKILYCALPDNLRQIKFYVKNGYIDDSFIENGFSTDDAFSFSNQYDYAVLNSRQGVFNPLEWFYYNHIVPEYSMKIDGVSLISIYRSIDSIIDNSATLSTAAYRPVTLAITRIFPDRNEELLLPLIGFWEELINPDSVIKDVSKIEISCLIKFPYSGKYNLLFLCKGNVELSIDGIKIAPSDIQHNLNTFEIESGKGFQLVNISIKYPASTKFILLWQRPDGKKEVVPPTYLLPAKNTELQNRFSKIN